MSVRKEMELMSIGQVARKLGIHEQTIRAYERKGLIRPQRTEKQTRFFTKEDMTGIIVIITLTQELGLNLAGVKILLNFARRFNMSNDELIDFIEDHKNSLQLVT
ncbi:MAG: MerR family transcriptional regulator [Candidatus Cloacimonetes bacterium]|nr:MerR family transcriptional regulator [Candidatus Cloacimonadota bacterium]